MGEYDFSKLSVGMNNLTNGYVAYAEEVIVNRALPALYDGLKPVNRRILSMLYKQDLKKGARMKSADLVGSTMKLHPHGDASIYSAMVLLTDRNGTMALPVLEGHGNFGGVNTTDPPAASRYTEIKMHDNAEAYFGEMDGINMIPNYDSSMTEPEFLPVSFPAVLCNAQEGIAVGFSCNIPSFNFNDVIDLTIECIKDGECHTVICPDFVTGGYYIRNNKELNKLMKVGKAQLKLRGKLTKVGKELTIVEFPYGVKIPTLLRQIQKADISGIKDCGDTSDFEHGEGILIDCAKNKVDDVQTALYRMTDLQCNFPASLMVIVDGEPKEMGVWEVVKKWVEWRKGVVTKHLQNELVNLKEKMKESRAFIEVFNQPEKKEQMLDLVLHVSDEAAIKYLLENFDNEIVTPDLASWLISRRTNVYRTGGKYVTQYNSLKMQYDECERHIQNIDEYLISQLEQLKAEKGSQHPRRTEVTNVDYEFIVSEDGEVQKDTTPCTYLFKDGFLKKLRINSSEEAEFRISASASDTLIALDNRGRILRVYCEDLPYSGGGELGLYLPRYLGLDETDDYKILWIGALNGETKMLLYKDGNVGFLDTSEWIGLNRKVHIIEKGIAVSIADKLGAVIDIPECLYVMDSSGKLGYAICSDIKRKDRTAKTRVWTLDKNASLTYFAPMSVEDGSFYVTNPAYYMQGKPQFLETEESLIGDAGLLQPMYGV